MEIMDPENTTPPTDPAHEWTVQDNEGTRFCRWCAAERTDEAGPCPVTDRDEPPAISDLASEPATPKYRVIASRTVRREVELTTEERLVASDRACELGEKVDEIEAQIDSAKEAWRDRLKGLQAKLDTAKDQHREALRARHTGKETRRFEAEERAIIPSATVEVVLVESGEVVESRPMSEAEQAKYCRQGDITDATGGATIATGESVPEPSAPESDERRTEKGIRCIGWPVAWEDQTWPVQVDDATVVLTEPHVWEVYVQTPSDGEGVSVGAVVKATEYQRQCVVRALDLLKGKGLARQVGKKWLTIIPTESAEPSSEGGRKDTLPEAGDITRPKLTEPETKADVVFADATDASALYGHA